MSVPSDDDILGFFEAHPQPLKPKALGHKLGLRKNEQGDLRKALFRLEHQGKLSQEGGKFGPPAGEAAQHTSHKNKPNHKEERRNSHRRFPERNANPADGAPPLLPHERKERERKPRKGEPVNMVGIVVLDKKTGELKVKPCDRHHHEDRLGFIAFGDGGATEGDVVVAEPTDKNHKWCRVTKVLGRENDPGMISTISLHEQGIRTEFSAAAMAQAQDPVKMAIPEIGPKRLDKRAVPFVTVDGKDARDFDDAVWAEKTDKGWHIMVAIADVSWYVRSGDDIDQDAYIRGNSSYFPDRAEPMLPRELSNGVCSLNPGVDRAVMIRERWIDNDGNLIKKLPPYRALINSAARLNYDQLQDAQNGTPDETTAPLMDNVVKPLYGAYEALAKARAARGTLDLEIPERKVRVTAEQGIEDIRKYERLDSHKLIEEFMLAANEDAAASLEEMLSPCMYRVHPLPPNKEKLGALFEYAQSFGIDVPSEAYGDLDEDAELDGGQLRQRLRAILAGANGKPFFNLIAETMLRTQAKASYSTENEGHFGLALDRYAHFTSPIRRYADLLVHRLLVTAFDLGEGGITKKELDILEEMAVHISETEMRSTFAERNSQARYAADYLSHHVGETLRGQISSVNEIGLFVKLDDTGVIGFIHRKRLPKDFYEAVEEEHALIGRDTGILYRTGAEIEVVLKAADRVSGLVDLLPANDQGADIPGYISKFAPPPGDDGHINGGWRQDGPAPG